MIEKKELMNETIIGMDATLAEFGKIAAAFQTFHLACNKTQLTAR